MPSSFVLRGVDHTPRTDIPETSVLGSHPGKELFCCLRAIEHERLRPGLTKTTFLAKPPVSVIGGLLQRGRAAEKTHSYFCPGYLFLAELRTACGQGKKERSVPWSRHRENNLDPPIGSDRWHPPPSQIA